jgi:hypothetical protein
MLYATPAPEESLAQGDILDACPIFGLEVPTTGMDLDAAPARWRERVVVLTQACDLVQTKTTKILVDLVMGTGSCWGHAGVMLNCVGNYNPAWPPAFARCYEIS